MARHVSLASGLSLLTVVVAACSGPSPTANDSASSTAAESAVAASARGSRERDRVFVLGNEAANQVIVFDAADDGALREIDRVATGGHGSDDGLGSQGALALSGDGHWLIAVNAGSSEVSLFRVSRGRLELADVAASGGTRPISVTESRGLVYVLNAGEPDQNVSGFTLDDRDGALRPLAGSSRALSSASPVGAAEVLFAPDGDALVVTEKATNTIDSFVVRRDGTLSDVRAIRSSGDTPFGFAFDRRGTLIVSDAFGGAAGAGAVSSYRLDHSAQTSLVTGPVADHQGAPCWVAVTRDGRFAYTTNTASGTVSGYVVASDGSLALFGDGGVSVSTGAGTKPTDVALDDEGHLLYVLESGTASVASFTIASDGTLSASSSAHDLPAHAAGLVATQR
jgi:6-phosphogluconolactonase